ncbi:protein adenylyltransferase SelO, mitochondrial isoform X2 [Pipistrellus kuhlii]|uniref:protein adenylyltransferase SelO, mitochondrial isoform X2 n=1 Tax=Pipistrellus kuhlii TaxID=59472 RepID=UPI001E26FD82|nr:protein adenylyltransferase SelO, mitochondrial isoform X2 [Pipistrellus kuhlii]
MASLKAVLGTSLPAARAVWLLCGCRPLPAPCSISAAAMEPAPHWLAGLHFDNRALRALPVETPPPDPEGAAPAPRLVPGFCFSRVRPAPLRQPRLVALSEPALALLGLGAPPAAAAAREAREAEAALFFSGNALLPGAEPAAHCYCGHQFGQFAGQLGDGAAMYLGEVCTAAGERWELQLKGAGPTPFSRLTAARSCAPASGSSCAARPCSTWGCPPRGPAPASRPSPRSCATCSTTATPSTSPAQWCCGSPPPSSGSGPLRSLRPRTSTLAVRAPAWAGTTSVCRCWTMWSALSTRKSRPRTPATPCRGTPPSSARYDPDHVCNASDNAGRYSFSKQPEVCKWNLQKLAEALAPELPLEQGEAILAEEYDAEFRRHYLHKMRRKLGLVQAEREEDAALVAKLLETMHLTGADFTNTFYLLSSFPVGPESPGLAEFLAALMEQCASLEELRLAFRPQMDPRQLSMMLMLAQSNPQLFALIGTRANVTKELERVEQQSRLEQLSPAELLSRNRGHWADWLQAYRARLEEDRAGAADQGAWQAERTRVMHANNPKYVLRNYIAQNAIEAAENGDFSEARTHPSLLPWVLQEGLGQGGRVPITPPCSSPGATGAEAAGGPVPQGGGGRRGPGGRRARGGRQPSREAPLLQQQAPALGRGAVCDVIFVTALVAEAPRQVDPESMRRCPAASSPPRLSMTAGTSSQDLTRLCLTPTQQPSTAACSP